MPNRKRVLIITYYWPPAGGSGVQRWVKFAKYLRDYGWEPIIYTPANADYALVDQSLSEELPSDLEVIKQPIWEPYALAQLFSRNKGKQRAGFLEDSKQLSYFQRKLLWIRANWFIPDARKFWVKRSTRFLNKYLKEQAVDAIVTNGPPHSMHLIGLGLKRKLNIKWLADFRDPWTSIDYLHHLPLTQRSIQKHARLEQAVLRTADQVTVVSNTMKEEFEAYTDKLTVIMNGHDLSSTRQDPTTLDTTFSLVHVGLMNMDRNPIRLWRILGELCKQDTLFNEKLRIKLIGEVSAAVLQSLKEAGIHDCCEFVGYLPHGEVHHFQRKAQVLLLAVNNVPSAKGIVTGKVFEYMAAHRPILAIGPEDGDLARLLRESKSGSIFGFSEEEDLKAHIIKLFDRYQEGKLLGSTVDVAQYSRKNLTEKMAITLNQIVA